MHSVLSPVQKEGDNVLAGISDRIQENLESGILVGTQTITSSWVGRRLFILFDSSEPQEYITNSKYECTD